MADLRKVFIVDNDDLFRRRMELELETMDGMATYAFSSVEECLKSMEAEPEVILVDVYMDSQFKEVMSGIDLLHWIKSNYPKTEVIIMTPDQSILRSMSVVEQNAFDCIEKTEAGISRVHTMLHIIFRHCDLQDNATMYKNSMYFMAASCFAVMLSAGGILVW